MFMVGPTHGRQMAGKNPVTPRPPRYLIIFLLLILFSHFLYLNNIYIFVLKEIYTFSTGYILYKF